MKKAILSIMLCALCACIYAQSLTWSDEETTALKAHGQEMQSAVDFLAADVMAAIQADYKVNPQDARALRRLCVRMEMDVHLEKHILVRQWFK